MKATCETTWLKRVLADVGADQEGPTTIFCDNQSVLKIARNLVFHEHTKHIEVHLHFIREQIQNDVVDLVYKPTEEQSTDIFTKPLGREKVHEFRIELGVRKPMRLTLQGGVG